MSTDLWSRFEQTVRLGPHRSAIEIADEACDFAALRARALSFAGGLAARGVKPGDRVLLQVENEVDCAAVILATWARGGIAVLVDSEERAPHLEQAIAKSEPRVVVDDPGELAADPTGATAAIETDAPASILFTSGSTGSPKGVTQTHASLALGCDTVGDLLGLSKHDRILCPVPWSFDYGYGQLLSTFLRGATQLLPAAGPAGPWQALATRSPTVLAGIPSFYAYLLHGPVRGEPGDGASLRAITSTGGALPGADVHALLERFPRAQLFLNYGLTESYRSSCLDPALAAAHSDSIGRAIPGVDLLVLREDGSQAEPGETGEIVHCGGPLFSGYWRDADATSRALRADPRDPSAARVLFTGDLGHFDATGLLYFDGRRDHQLKSMGVRVGPGEVERLLLESDLLAEVAVFGQPHDLIGDEVWAAIVLREPGRKALRSLEAHAHRKLSRYAKPRRYLELEALPRTSTGKVDYPALSALAASDATRSLR